MVAPGNVHRVVLFQQLQHAIRPGSPVEYIPHHVQSGHCKMLNQRGNLHNKPVGFPHVNQGLQQAVMIGHLVIILIRLGVKQFVQQKGICLRHSLAHLLPGIFGGKQFAERNHLLQGAAVPFPGKLLLLFQPLELFLGIVNQRTQAGDLPARHGSAEKHIDLFPDDAGAVIQNMAKRLVLPVNVTHEMFRALGQRQVCLQVHDFRAQRLYRRIPLCQKRQVFQPLRCIFLLPHCSAPLLFGNKIMLSRLWSPALPGPSPPRH